MLVGTAGDRFGDSPELENVSFEIRAIVGLSTPLDFTDLSCYTGEDYVTVTALLERFLGGTQTEMPDVYALASPITYVKRGAPPVFLIHGENDTVVPLVQAENYLSAADAAGMDVSLLVAPGANHNLRCRGIPPRAGRADGHPSFNFCARIRRRKFSKLKPQNIFRRYLSAFAALGLILHDTAFSDYLSFPNRKACLRQHARAARPPFSSFRALGGRGSFLFQSVTRERWTLLRGFPFGKDDMPPRRSTACASYDALIQGAGLSAIEYFGCRPTIIVFMGELAHNFSPFMTKIGLRDDERFKAVCVCENGVLIKARTVECPRLDVR